MDCRALASHRLPRQSKLFLDYLEHFSRVASFYPNPPEMASVSRVARELKFPAERTREVVAALRAQNTALGASPAVLENLNRLERGAVVVVSGQQVGLFTGPAYSFYKALTAIQLAAELTQSGTDAVPIFWMATEDHDVEEVRHVSWFQDGTLRRFELPSPEIAAGSALPVGRVPLGAAVEEQVHQAADLLARQGSTLLAHQLRDSYGARETYGSAFAKLFAKLFASQGLILLEPLDPALHHIAAPVYRQAIQDRDALNEKLLLRGKQLEASGYTPQVKVSSKSTLLFHLGDDARSAITAVGNSKFQAGAKSWDQTELLGTAESRPQDFSPSALLRAVVQDYLLPTVAYVGGPAEISYFAQSEVIYRHILGRMPVILPRPDFTLLDVKAEKLLRTYKLEVEDIWAGAQEMRRRMESVSVPKQLSKSFDRNHQQVAKMLDDLESQMDKLDPTLQGAVATARKKIDYQIDKLRRKTGRALDNKAQLLTAHEYFLENLLYPHKVLQSRELCLLPFLARWGPGGLADLQKLCSSQNLGRHCIVQFS